MSRQLKKNLWPLHAMLIPGVLIVLVYNYVPMFGLVMAFQNYLPAKGIVNSEWIGLGNFKYLMSMANFPRVISNTVLIAAAKIMLGIIVPVSFALLLNEVRNKLVKRGVQTLIYLPHFLSWVILAGILVDVLSPNEGILNRFLGLFGIEPIFFLGDNKWFPGVVVVSDIWKEFGYGTIIYLAALTGIDPSLYEVSRVDGANRWQQLMNITLPGIAPIVVLMTTLSLGNVLNAGFDQIFNLYSPIVYESGDIIDTLVYRIGLENAQFSVATAVGLFKSLVSLVLIVVSYRLAFKLVGYRIF